MELGQGREEIEKLKAKIELPEKLKKFNRNFEQEKNIGLTSVKSCLGCLTAASIIIVGGLFARKMLIEKAVIDKAEGISYLYGFGISIIGLIIVAQIFKLIFGKLMFDFGDSQCKKCQKCNSKWDIYLHKIEKEEVDELDFNMIYIEETNEVYFGKEAKWRHTSGNSSVSETDYIYNIGIVYDEWRYCENCKTCVLFKARSLGEKKDEDFFFSKKLKNNLFFQTEDMCEYELALDLLKEFDEDLKFSDIKDDFKTYIKEEEHKAYDEIFEVIKNGKVRDIPVELQFFEEEDGDENSKDSEKTSLFKYVKNWIEEDRDVNQKDLERISLLEYAVRANNIEIVNLLLEHNAKIKTAEEIAIVANKEVIKIVLERDLSSAVSLFKIALTEEKVALENIQYIFEMLDNKSKKEVLSQSISNTILRKDNARINVLDILKYLIDNGADINEFNYDDLTPLMQTIINSSPEYYKFLIENGADVELKNKQRKTVSDYLKEKGYNSIEDFLNASSVPNNLNTATDDWEDDDE